MKEHATRVIRELEDKKKRKIREITKLNNQKYDEIKIYYNEITNSNLSRIKDLKKLIATA